MSRELEMLREMAKPIPETAPFVRCPKCDTAQEVYRHINDRMVSVADLRAILRRLEAAERVAESLGRSDWGRNIADQSGIGDAYDAYRALDAEETK